MRLALTLGLTPIIVHGLGLAQYGIYSLMTSVYAFFVSFDGGISPTAGRYFAVYAGADDKRRTTRLLTTLVTLILVLSAIFSVGIYFAAPHLVLLFHMPHHLRPSAVFVFRIIGFLVGSTLLTNVFSAVITARHKYALVSITGTLTFAVMTVGLIIVVHLHRGVRDLGVLLVLQQIVSVLLIVPAACRFLKVRHVGFLTWKELRGVLSFAGKAQSSGVAALINTEVDTLLIGLLLPIQIVGIYNIGATFAQELRGVAGNALTPIRNQVGSTFGRFGPERALAQFKELQKMWVVAVTGWMAAGIGASYFGITAWLGPKFHLASVLCVILLAGYAINLYTGMTTIYLNTIGRPGVETLYGGVAIVINVAFTAALAVFGAVGIVGATGIAFVVASSYLMRIVHKRVSKDIPNFFNDVPIVSGIVAGLISFGVGWAIHSHLPQGAVGLLLSGLAAIPGLLVFAIMNLRVSRMVEMGWRSSLLHTGRHSAVPLQGTGKPGRRGETRSHKGLDWP